MMRLITGLCQICRPTYKFYSIFVLLIATEVSKISCQSFPKYVSVEYPGVDVCALDDVTVTYYRVTTQEDCLVLCKEMTPQLYRLGCLSFNYRSGQNLCELFVYVPNDYQPISGCVHYQQPQLSVIPQAYSNLALKRTAYQSSDYYDHTFGYNKWYTANLAVDGNADPYFYRSNSCTATWPVAGINSWWAVDLGSPYLVKWVNLTNRVDLYPERMRDFAIILTNISPKNYVGKNFIPQERSICAFRQGQVAAGATVTVVCRKDVRPGQYLYIEQSDTDHLTLCEVEVFGDSAHAGK